MARPRRYGSDAERQAAYRERLRLQSSPAPVEEFPPEEDFSPRVNVPQISEADYVEREVEITRRQIAGGLKDPDGKRLERAKSYATWRYRGFVAGEVEWL